MIEWTIDQEIFSIGIVSIRYYSLLFLVSFIMGLVIMKKIFALENYPAEEVDDLLVYMVIGTVLGARFGHVLFYGFDYYMSNPIEIIKVWKGGLASHGAAIGILVSLHFFVKTKNHYNYLWLIDRLVITVALSGFFIRMGNLFNSEIIGKPTDVPWSFIFSKYVDKIPRHPTQLYEALAYLTLFFIIYKIYMAHKEKTRSGYIFGIFLVWVFGFRIFVEQFKENQESFENDMILNMGQILSIPLVILGIYMIYTSRNRSLPAPYKPPKEKKKKQKNG